MIRVSILIPCYNAGRYLASTIRSAIAQLPPAQVEILLWDDGSTDDSLEVARRYSDQVKILGDGENRGGNVARQRLTEAASGEWLQYLDADDVLLPGKITEQLSLADAADIIYAPPIALPASDSRWETIDGQNDDQWRAKNSDDLHRKLEVPNELLRCTDHTDPWVKFIRWGDFQTTSMLFRRETLVDAGGWKLDQPRCQEHELILRLMQQGARIVRCPEQKTVYRVHEGTSVSRRNLAATVRTRMELTDQVLEHLRRSGELATTHLNALRAVWLEAARQLHQEGESDAKRYFARAGRVGVLRADDSDALPHSYRWCAAGLGFSAAEIVAKWKRGG